MRGRYRAILIDSEQYLLAVARYIHHNPLEARRVSNIDEYRWSSHFDIGDVASFMALF